MHDTFAGMNTENTTNQENKPKPENVVKLITYCLERGARKVDVARALGCYHYQLAWWLSGKLKPQFTEERYEALKVFARKLKNKEAGNV